MQIRHCQAYTIKSVNQGEGTVSVDDFQRLVNVLDWCCNFFADQLGKHDSHLFVMVLAGDSIATGSDDLGLGVYFSGTHSILIAGLPTDIKDWHIESIRTLMHEFVHYLQDLDGTLEQSEENERATDEYAEACLREFLNTAPRK